MSNCAAQIGRWDPSEYQRHSSAQQQWAQELFDRLQLRGDERILDIGCGDGKITAQIAQRVPRGSVLGVDSSAEMIAFARRSFGPPSLANLRFEEANAASLTFGPEFDCVVSFACLHWVIDHRPVLAGIRRALRPGGRMLLQFGGRGNAAEAVACAATVIERDCWRNYFKDFPFPWGFHDPREYRAWLQEAQLEPTRVELVPKDMTHRGREGLIGWVRTTWMPYFHRVPPQEQETFIAEVADEYLRLHPPDGQQLVHLKMVRLEVEARRGV